MYRFTILDVLWLTVVVAVGLGLGLGWWRDRVQVRTMAEELRLLKEVRRDLFPDIQLGEPMMIGPGIRLEFEVNEDGTSLTLNRARVSPTPP